MKYTHIFVIIILSLIYNNVFAYQPVSPNEKMYESKNCKYRLTVKPGDEQNFYNSIGESQNTEQVDNSRDKCIGILEQKVKSNYVQIWVKELDNDVSPASALVSNSGKYVVTFDNWHLGGQGDNVVVIYNEQGEIIKKFSLEDFISPTEEIRLSRTYPGWIIFWGEDHEIDDENESLVLKLLIKPFPYVGPAPSRDREILTKMNEENEKWAQNKNKTRRRIRLSDGLLLDKPIIDKRFEYPKFECERGQHVIQGPGDGARLWQMCIIDNELKSKGSENNRHGKYQVSSFINGAWFIEVRGQYINGKRHGTWTQVFNEGDMPCVKKYDHGVIVEEKCPQGWWGTF
jgi:hypothetical protein